MTHDDIIQLTAELIAEYAAAGYDPHDLQPGDWVWLDDGGELYLTDVEIDIEICQVQSALDGSKSWGDESWQDRLDVLLDAQRRLAAASSGR